MCLQFYCVRIPKIKEIYSGRGELLNVIEEIKFWFHKVLVHNLDYFLLCYNYNYEKLNLNVLNI